MPNKYHATINIDLSIEANTKSIARKSIKDVPWEDIIRFEYPTTGFVREFRINASDSPVKILNLKKVTNV